MPNILYPVSNTPGSNTAYAQDFNQVENGINGTADVGDITAFPQITSLPGALTSTAGASGVLTGAYSYQVTFVTGLVDGTGALHVKGETLPGTISTTVNTTAQNINLTNIPIGPTGTIARKIYRTKAGGSVYYLAFQISDNTTTSWTDSTTDTSLVTVVPTSNTTGSQFVGNASGLTNIPAENLTGGPISTTILSNATPTTPGIVEVPASPTSGAPIASSRVATASETLITGTTAQTIATYTPTAQGNFETRCSFRVITGATNVTVTVTYTSATGTQTLTALNAQPCAVGDYILDPFTFNSVSGSAISIQITASVANQVYASGGITGV